MKNQSSKKSHGQQSRVRKPKPTSRRATIIICPDKDEKIDVQTGNVSDLEMYKYLSDLSKHFAKVLIDDATEVVGDNPEDQVKYLDWRI